MAVSTANERAYEEIVEFLAAGPRPADIVAFQPSDDVRQRVRDLIHQEKTSGVSPEERSELDHYMLLEHLMVFTKARARRYLTR